MATTNHFFIPLLICISSFSLTKAQVSVKVGSTPKQTMRYGMDYERLWYWTTSLSSAEKDLVSKWSVADNDIDFIRVAINNAYELTEGDYNISAYTNKIIPMMQDMKDANPNIKFFASPRPLDEAMDNVAWQPYPQWITGSTGSNSNFSFNWEKCAEYLVRYIELMHSYGFEISYLDITNEWNYVTPTHVRDIAEYLEDDLARKGLTMPKVIAPSTWSYAQGASWLNNVNTTRRRDAIDIVASHNTDPGGSAEAFVERAHDILGTEKEIWNTELHDWKSTSGYNEVLTFSYMMEAINAGFSGLTGWLAIGTKNQGHCYILNPSGTPSRNVKYFIFNKLTNTSHRGQALDIETPNELSHTTALIKDNLLTVWAVNPNNTDVNISIDLTDYTSTNQQVIRTYWNTNSNIEGIVSTYTTTNASSINGTVPAGSLSCFEIPLDTDTPVTFTPDPNKTYYIDAPHHNLRLAATGESEDAYTTSTTTTGADVEWKFVDRENGYWHIQRAAGGSKPRLRTDQKEDADMQPTSSRGTWTYFDFTKGVIENTYFLTLPAVTTDFKRLQIDRDGVVKMVGDDRNGTWESFRITEVGSDIAEFTRIEAEDYDAMSGIKTENSTESGDNVGWINNGDWLRFDDIDITGAQSVYLRIACNFTGGTIEIRTGSTTGNVIGSTNVSNTGGNQNWVTLNASINNASGVQDLYLVFKGGSGYLFNINWLEFSANSNQSNKDVIASSTSELTIYPNPITNTMTINSVLNSILTIYDMNGSAVFTTIISSEKETINVSDLAAGIYFTEVKGVIDTSIIKIVKQ